MGIKLHCKQNRAKGHSRIINKLHIAAQFHWETDPEVRCSECLLEVPLDQYL